MVARFHLSIHKIVLGDFVLVGPYYFLVKNNF